MAKFGIIDGNKRKAVSVSLTAIPKVFRVNENQVLEWKYANSDEWVEIYDLSQLSTGNGYLELQNTGLISPIYTGSPVVFFFGEVGDVDQIDEHLHITADGDGLYNSSTDEGYFNEDIGGPRHTLWKVREWANYHDLLIEEDFTTFYQLIDSNDIENKELVMKDTQTGYFYAIKFLSYNYDYNSSSYVFSYIRQKINTDIYFRIPSGENVVAEISENVHLTRIDSFFFNALSEEAYDWETNISPAGSLWAIATDEYEYIESYFYDKMMFAIDYNDNEDWLSKHPLIMKDTTSNEYYMVHIHRYDNEFGVVLTANKLDVDNPKIGIKFGDGSRQTTAYPGPSNIIMEERVEYDGDVDEVRIETYNGGSKFVYGYIKHSIPVEFVSTTDNIFRISTLTYPLVDDIFIDGAIDPDVYEIYIILSEGNSSSMYDIPIENISIDGIDVLFGSPYNINLAGYSSYKLEYKKRNYDAIRWWDVDDSPSGDDDYVGAIIDFRAYVNNVGGYTGTIHITKDSFDSLASAIAFGGSSEERKDYCSFTHTLGSDGLGFVINPNDSEITESEVTIYFTSKIFYGGSYW